MLLRHIGDSEDVSSRERVQIFSTTVGGEEGGVSGDLRRDGQFDLTIVGFDEDTVWWSRHTFAVIAARRFCMLGDTHAIRPLPAPSCTQRG